MNRTIVIDGNPLKLTKIYPVRIGGIGDLHVGSLFAIACEGFGWELNESQKKLLEYWKEYAMECIANKITQLWIVGDLISGNDRRNHGKYNFTDNLDTQTEMAAKLIIDFVHAVKSIETVIIWGGTPYHTSEDITVEKMIVDKLRAEGINAVCEGEYSYITIKYKDFIKRIFVTHSVRGTSHPETALGMNMREWQEKVAQGKLPPVDMQVSAHKHEFVEVHKASIRAVQLPCWQLFVPYDSALKYFARYQPDIGGTIILFDDKLRTMPWHFTYPSFLPENYNLNIVAGVEAREKEHQIETEERSAAQRNRGLGITFTSLKKPKKSNDDVNKAIANRKTKTFTNAESRNAKV